VYRGTASGGEAVLATLGNVTSYTNTGLTNGSAYYYKVTSINGVGEGPASSEVSAIPITLPTAPQGATAARGDRQVSLSWQPPSSNGGSAIGGYRVYRGTTPGGEILVATIGNVTSYTNAGLTNGVRYYFTIAAVNGAGEGPASNEASATPATTPTAPAGVTATAGNGQVSLAWQVPSSNGGDAVFGYRVYLGTAPGAESPIASVSTPSYTATGLTNATRYYFKVSALNTVGEGSLSSEVSALPVGPPSPPQAPGATVAWARVTLTWQAPATNGGSTITSYRVSRGTSAGSETAIATVAGSVTTYADDAVAPGTTYFYTIAAVNGVGTSAASSEVVATTLRDTTPPAAMFTTPDGSLLVSTPVRTDHVTGTATDDVSGVASVHVSWEPLVGGSAAEADAALTCDTPRTSCTWTASPPLVPGLYTVRAVARDRAGNAQPGGSTISVLVI
jgi:predicted phage tail protein